MLEEIEKKTVVQVPGAVGSECPAISLNALQAEAAERRFFFQYLGAGRRHTPRTRVGLKVREDASHRDLSGATLRSDLARRHAPKSCQK